jgi:MFS family permease
MDVDDAIAAIGVGRFHYRMLVLVGIIFGAEAMEVLLLTFIRDGVADELGGTAVTLSLIPAAMFTGMFVGALAWGIIADTIGRQRTLHWLVAVQIAGGMAARDGGVPFAVAELPDYNALRRGRGARGRAHCAVAADGAAAACRAGEVDHHHLLVLVLRSCRAERHGLRAAHF